ncbi:anti-CBASS protein Acb1 family protein [Yersinia rochesterensis]|uniref:anti-CBASS protein Acb1 family protein n=1 Tax=Yersinia rochesterensis TaxID=1604335 RepID=UPI0011A237B6|nr:anti-CBASS Acb1 family protein [Yersinia rochesterensis]
MTDKLQLAVNHALQINSAISESAIARARMGLIDVGMGLDAKRANAWCEYGFKQELTFDDLYRLYRRGGIAHGAVNKLIGTCWLTNPEIIEGEEKDESGAVTSWEKSLKAVFNSRLWQQFADADMRRLVGRYSGLLLHVRDSGAWNTSVVKGRGLEKLTPVWAGSLVPSEWDTDLNSTSYGNPKMWQYSEMLPNGTSRRVKIHPDRVFILGDYSRDAIGFLEPAYNAFVSLEKVEGGSGESFLKNAARQLNLNFEKEINFSNLASLYGVSVDELQDKFNEAATEINRGNDVLLTTQGASVTPLVTAVADPEPTYNVNLQTVSSAVDIPARILAMSQTGERASTEDNRYFNTRCQSRRNRALSFDIEDFCNKLIDLDIIDSVSMKTVIWDELNEQTASEKLDSAVKMSQINSTSMATGEAPFSSEEIRVAAGYEPDGIEPLGETDDVRETETGDNPEE